MRNNHGQALVEYVLIIAIISVITVSIVNFFGGYLKDTMTKTSCDMMSRIYVEGNSPGEAKCVTKEEYERLNLKNE